MLRLPLFLSTSYAAASLWRPLSISSVWHHHVEIQLSTLYTAPSSSTASWHGLYKPLDLHEGERRVKLQSYLLFYNTLYSNTLARILGVMFNDSISCKCSMVCSSSTKWDRPELSMPICFAVTNLLFKHKSIFHFSWPLVKWSLQIINKFFIIWG